MLKPWRAGDMGTIDNLRGCAWTFGGRPPEQEVKIDRGAVTVDLSFKHVLSVKAFIAR